MDVLAALRERILSYAASRYGRQIAEDLSQEVLLVLHQKYPHVTAIEELVPLSFQILRFKITSYARKIQRRGEHTTVDVTELPLADEQVDLVLQAERREMVDRLLRCLPMLGERCQNLFRLKLAGCNFAEIQTELGAASINTVYTWDARCRAELKELMTKERSHVQ
jgi:RNA polymerase sigma-70 factor (ECF subfamily)